MTQQGTWPRVAVVGAGAVGGYFGGLMAHAGAPVVMIGRTSFVEAVKNAGLFLDTLHFQKSVRVEASTELSAAHGAALFLFCVKTTDSAATARELAPFLAPDATLVSLQNETGDGIVILGSGSIVSQLAQEGLIDEFQMALNPVVLGRGRTLFQGDKGNLNLKLTKSRTFHNGNVFLCDEPMT